MNDKRIGRGGRILLAIGVLALAAMTISAGIATADDGDDERRVRATTSGGRVTVALGGTSVAKSLPLTRVTVAGQCQHAVPPPGSPFGSSMLARPLVAAAPGRTLDAFAQTSGTIGGQTLLAPPVVGALLPGTGSRFGSATLVLTSNGATATIAMGASIDLDAGTCTFLWQAVESASS